MPPRDTKPLPDGTPAARNPEEFAASMGWQIAIFRERPKLWKWLNEQFAEYAKNPAAFSEERFTIELQQQPFWQKHSEAFIRDRQFELTYPQQWNAAVDKDVESARDVLVTMGAVIPDDVLRKMVIEKRRGGYNDAQWNNQLARYVSLNNGRFTGQAGADQSELQQWATRNGVSLSENMVSQYVRRLAAGDTTLDDIKNEVRKTYLAGAYPAWSDKILQGFDPADLFTPYLTSARELLENSNITLSDPIMQKITQAVTPDGKPMAMPLYQAQQMIRKDARWQRTDNAYGMYANVANDVLRTFGFQ